MLPCAQQCLLAPRTIVGLARPQHRRGLAFCGPGQGEPSLTLLLGSPWRAALSTQERDGKQRSHLAMLRYIHDAAKLTKARL